MMSSIDSSVTQQQSICFVYKEDYPWDVRVEKILDALLEKDYRVSLVCRNLKGLPQRESRGNLDIYRMPAASSFPKGLRKLLNFALFINPIWVYLVFRVASKSKCFVVIVRDLPLLPIAVLWGRLTNRPVIYDMAECYPEMYRSAQMFEERKLSDYFFKSPKLASLMEMLCCKYVFHIFTMIEESRRRLVDKGIEERKLSIVSNTPNIGDAPSTKVHRGEELRIVYVGFVTRLRGLDLLIRAVRHYLDDARGGNQIRVDIIGRGSSVPELEQLVQRLDLADHVNMHGWLDKADMRRLVEGANVGALTYRVCAHWNHTIPNKIFDYMHEGIPVLATNVVPIERILIETDAGIVSPDGNVEEMKASLLKLKDPQIRQRLGNNGKKAIAEKYNWGADKEIMYKVIAGISV